MQLFGFSPNGNIQTNKQKNDLFLIPCKRIVKIQNMTSILCLMPVTEMHKNRNQNNSVDTTDYPYQIHY